jgi:hypothetical protein
MLRFKQLAFARTAGQIVLKFAYRWRIEADDILPNLIAILIDGNTYPPSSIE